MYYKIKQHYDLFRDIISRHKNKAMYSKIRKKTRILLHITIIIIVTKIGITMILIVIIIPEITIIIIIYILPSVPAERYCPSVLADMALHSLSGALDFSHDVPPLEE